MTDPSSGTPAASDDDGRPAAAARQGSGAPSKRPRGRERYPADVVVDAPPASARAAAAELAAGPITQGRLVLAQHETAAVRPPAHLPPVPHPPAPPSAPRPPAEAPAAAVRLGRRLVAGGRFEGPLHERSFDDADPVLEARPRPERQRSGSHAAPAARDRVATGPGSHAAPPGPVLRRSRDRSAARRPGPAVMGVLNVAPDSFSDGGRHLDVDAALAHARVLVAQGADVVDVGGESPRPGAARVGPAAELRRVLPVVRELASEGVRVSIDTMNASTAAAALEAGAEIVNDVSGGLADVDMARVVAESGRTFVVMHWRGRLDGSGHAPAATSRDYDGDVVGTVADELGARVDDLVARGVDASTIVLDPGLGFSKDALQNWQLLAHLDVLGRLGLPVLVAASRRRSLADLVPGGAPPVDRAPATAVISVLAAQADVWGVRVHDVAGTRAALDVLQAWTEAAAAPRRPARHA
ncbi:dihydropteroate synthase [Frigoribacterium sp. RIT-PI-h]|uniref:dihydropteroate synthase n=1 Tax=Frigoribacterium sp. RIT-PI-h TaxID=1690245 RepID=UPI000A46D6DC